MIEQHASLSSQQWQTLQAVIDRLIPPDEFPGGWEAGVGNYLRRQFASDLADKVTLYESGLDAVEAEAGAAADSAFAELGSEAQDELLSRIEKGDVRTSWPVAPERFFQMLVTHAMEGFYADPGNGGNHKGVAWEMIGFEVRG